MSIYSWNCPLPLHTTSPSPLLVNLLFKTIFVPPPVTWRPYWNRLQRIITKSISNTQRVSCLFICTLHCMRVCSTKSAVSYFKGTVSQTTWYLTIVFTLQSLSLLDVTLALERLQTALSPLWLFSSVSDEPQWEGVTFVMFTLSLSSPPHCAGDQPGATTIENQIPVL